MKKILKKIEEIGFRSSNIMVTFSTFGDLLNKRKENDYVVRVIFTILGWIPILIILFVAVVILIKYL